ncbi:MAG: dihydrofolate reductase [Candidatus Saccharibacteria bacterium]|nr:dihydrofolate reductase [Candidatus Saccharibacteria bacterium]
MSFSLIAAVGQNNELGKKGGLVFKIPGDLKFFKETTVGHPVFMGLNTWRSLPGKLPQREHFVLAPDAKEVPEDLHAVTDLDAFISEHKDETEEYFVIGGGMVYKQMLPHCTKLYLTEVKASDGEADTFFPEFDKNLYKRTVLKSGQDGEIAYDHVLYERAD